MRSTRPLRIFQALACVLFCAWAASAAQEVRVVRQDDRSLVLRVSAPDVELAAYPAQRGRVEPKIRGAASFVEDSLPRLPYSRALIGVPEGMRPVLTILSAPHLRISGEKIAVAVHPAFGLAEAEGWEEPEDPPLPAGRYPRRAAEIAWTGWMRDLQVSEVRFYPVRSAGAAGGVLHHPVIEARVEFVADPSAVSPRRRGPASLAQGRRDTYRELQRRAILNPDQVLPAAGAGARRDSFSAPAQAGEETSVAGGLGPEAALMSVPAPLKISVNSEGLYRVTPADLAAAGVDPNSVNPQDFRLEYRGAAVPMEVLGESDASFDPNDRVVFFGTAATGPFTRTNVYWLHFNAASPRAALRDGTFGSPAPTPASFVTTVHAEQNLVYTSAVPTAAIDHWWWGPFLSAGGSATYTVSLPSVDPNLHTVNVRVNLQGRTFLSGNPDHHTRIFLNNTQIDDRTWDGQIPFTHNVSVSSSLLLNGNNSVRVFMVGNVGSPDQVYSNYIEIDYRRTYAAASDSLIADGEGTGDFRFSMTGFTASNVLVYDATDPNALERIGVPPAQITGAGPFTVSFQDSILSDRRYAAATFAALRAPLSIVQDAPSTLMTPSNGADYIAVTPPEFLSALQPLLALRASQGYRVLTAVTDDIYDEFNFGIMDPAAIKAFLSYAYANYAAPAPEFVLLAGDAHVDYLDNLGSGVKQFVPAILVNISGFGETPSDNEYVTVAGGDLLPEMWAGRLPARTATDVTDMVNKILAYETSPPVADLNAQSLFVADNDQVEFEAYLGSFASHLPPTMAANNVFLSQLACPFNVPSPPCAAARDAIRAGMDAGALVTTYLGHGSVTQWTGECAWATSNVSPCFSNHQNLLAATNRPTFIAALDCINGYFVDLTAAGSGHVNFSLAEQMMKVAGKGGIAVWAPAALGNLSDYSSIGDWLFLNIFNDRERVVGRAAGMAVISAVTQPFQPASMDNIRELDLFGDPATNLALDSDGDDLTDLVEEAAGTNPLDGDSDDDGVADGQETALGADADGDGLVNGMDPDADDDCIFDGTERGVTAIAPGTNPGAGFFVPDADPNVTTDPLNPDTDGGGAADGAEDTDFNGAVGSGETNPASGQAGDDTASVLPEVMSLTVDVSGDDLVLSWGGLAATHPCVRYRVYVADDNPAPKNSFTPFTLLAVTSAPGYTHVGARIDGLSHDYLVVAFDPLTGPLGHYGQ